MNVVYGISSSSSITYASKKMLVTATRNTNNTITIERENLQKGKNSLWRFYLCMFITMPFNFFVIIPNILKNNLSVYAYLLGALTLFITGVFMAVRVRLEGKETVKNHGAEHMVYNAYTKLGKIPSIAYTKKVSRYCVVCGSNMLSVPIMIQLITFILFYILYRCTIAKLFGPTEAYIVMFIGYIYINIKGLQYYNSKFLGIFGRIFQLITTAKPDNKNLKLAIAALEELEKTEA